MTIYSVQQQRKYQRSASLAFVSIIDGFPSQMAGGAESVSMSWWYPVIRNRFLFFFGPTTSFHQANNHALTRRLHTGASGWQFLWRAFCLLNIISLQESHQHHLNFHQGKSENKLLYWQYVDTWFQFVYAWTCICWFISGMLFHKYTIHLQSCLC